LRTHRDRAMVLAMLLAGLRRCEVLGLRFTDVQVADRRLVITQGKGGHHRVVLARSAPAARSTPARTGTSRRP
jgi:integrase/recombinase XerD